MSPEQIDHRPAHRHLRVRLRPPLILPPGRAVEFGSLGSTAPPLPENFSWPKDRSSHTSKAAGMPDRHRPGCRHSHSRDSNLRSSPDGTRVAVAEVVGGTLDVVLEDSVQRARRALLGRRQVVCLQLRRDRPRNIRAKANCKSQQAAAPNPHGTARTVTFTTSAPVSPGDNFRTGKPAPVFRTGARKARRRERLRPL